ncbi:MAG: hypothetical protein MK180_02395 [Rhodobacteraceae bacterium]|nr:hypothetical protein [Paracoccaceae bacterium]
MKAAFIAPLRVTAADWVEWTSLVSRIHLAGEAADTLGPDWHVVDGTAHRYHAVTDTGPLAQDEAPCEDIKHPLMGLLAVLDRVRRNAFASTWLDDDSVLLNFESGDAALVELHRLPDEAPAALAAIEVARHGIAG